MTGRDHLIRLAYTLAELRALVATDLPLRGYPCERAERAEEVARDLGRLAGHEGRLMCDLPSGADPPDRLQLAMVDGWLEGHHARLWAERKEVPHDE